MLFGFFFCCGVKFSPLSRSSHPRVSRMWQRRSCLLGSCQPGEIPSESRAEEGRGCCCCSLEVSGGRWKLGATFLWESEVWFHF